MAKHNETGERGEDIAEKYLEKKGFLIVNRNYRKKWGELDIVAEKDGFVHFIEVKTVNRKSFGGRFEQEINDYRPEDNMHPWKVKRLKRAILTYMAEKHIHHNSKWQFDLICVFLDIEKQIAKVRFIKNLIL